MTKTVALDLGQTGLAHMKDWYQGWEGKLADFAGLYLKKFHHCLAFVPEGTTFEEATHFDTGRYWHGGPEAIANYLLAVHKQHPEYCLVVMDYCHQPADPHVPEFDHVFFYKDQVYSYLNSADFTEENLIDTLRTLAQHSMGFVIKGSIDETLYEKRFIPAILFENLTKNIEMISLSAYDEESYLLAY